MVGGFSTPKKDAKLKVSSGQLVKAGTILCRGILHYKAGVNVKGVGALHARCAGKVYFTHKKTNMGKLCTYLNITPVKVAQSA